MEKQLCFPNATVAEINGPSVTVVTRDAFGKTEPENTSNSIRNSSVRQSSDEFDHICEILLGKILFDPIRHQ